LVSILVSGTQYVYLWSRKAVARGWRRRSDKR